MGELAAVGSVAVLSVGLPRIFHRSALVDTCYVFWRPRISRVFRRFSEWWWCEPGGEIEANKYSYARNM